MHPLSLFGWEQRKIPSVYAQRFIHRVMLIDGCAVVTIVAFIIEAVPLNENQWSEQWSVRACQIRQSWD
jgi:hypothetical protein